MFEKILDRLKYISQSKIQLSILPPFGGMGSQYSFPRDREIDNHIEPDFEENIEFEENHLDIKWINDFYGFDFNSKTGSKYLDGTIGEELKKYRYYIPNALSSVASMINHTLCNEQKRLVSSDVYDSCKLGWVLLDKPKVNKDTIDQVYGNLSFSNKYILFTDDGIGFKLNTKFLNNRKYLLQIGKEILNDQKGDFLENSIYQELEKKGGEIQRSKLFKNFGIKQLETSWYIFVYYTEQYKDTILRR